MKVDIFFLSLLYSSWRIISYVLSFDIVFKNEKARIYNGHEVNFNIWLDGLFRHCRLNIQNNDDSHCSFERSKDQNSTVIAKL